MIQACKSRINNIILCESCQKNIGQTKLIYEVCVS